MSKIILSKSFFLIIFSSLIIKISSKNRTNKRKYSDESNSNDEEPFSGNPYLILRIPPWSKFEDVQKRFELIRERAELKNKLNSKEFKLCKRAYEVLEEEYEKNNSQDKSFFGVLFKTFKRIFFYELIMLGLLFLTWFVYTCNSYAAFLVGTFVVIDNIIPHWFNNMFTQYLVSFIFGTLLYFKDYILGRKKKDEQNKNEDNSGGPRKRRRFEKIE